MWIKGGKLLNDEFQFITGDLQTNGEQIEAIGRCEKAKAIDASGCYVVPGFIDTHMHGAMGKTFIDFDADTFETKRNYLAGASVVGSKRGKADFLYSIFTQLC